MKRTRRAGPNCGFCECGDHAFADVKGGYVTFVSASDAHLLQDYLWTAPIENGKPKHARRTANGTSKLLHREVVTAKSVDHINRNTLDNRRTNLRSATPSGQVANRSKYTGKSEYKGVHRTPDGTFCVQVWWNNVKVFTTTVADENLAAKLYDTVSQHYHKEYHAGNFTVRS